jgi:heme/copper-type cytochrome/quinol oxidase subunit 2
MLNSRYTTVILESPKEWQLGFQDGATSIMEGIVDLHSDVFFVMLTIGFLVIFMVAVSIFKFNSNKRSNFNDVKHHTLLEVI